MLHIYKQKPLSNASIYTVKTIFLACSKRVTSFSGVFSWWSVSVYSLCSLGLLSAPSYKKLIFMSWFSKLSLEKHPHLIAYFIKCLFLVLFFFYFSIAQHQSAPRFAIRKHPEEQCVILACRWNRLSTSVKSKTRLLYARYDLKCFSSLENGDYIQG